MTAESSPGPEVIMPGMEKTPEERIAFLEETVRRVFRDRREPDKVTAYCLRAMPELVETALQRAALLHQEPRS